MVYSVGPEATGETHGRRVRVPLGHGAHARARLAIAETRGSATKGQGSASNPGFECPDQWTAETGSAPSHSPCVGGGGAIKAERVCR